MDRKTMAFGSVEGIHLTEYRVQYWTFLSAVSEHKKRG